MSLPRLTSNLSIPLSISTLIGLLLWLCSGIDSCLSPSLSSPLILGPYPYPPLSSQRNIQFSRLVMFDCLHPKEI